MMKQLIIPTFFFLLLNSLFAHADNLDRQLEIQISEKLEEKAIASEFLWLDANGEKFLALLTEQTGGKAEGAVIILHSMGGHADWPQTISPLRTILPKYGWMTLSIQLPVIAPENQNEDYGITLTKSSERIKAAIRLLHDRKFLNVVAIGHSFGAASLLSYLQNQKEQKIIAMAAIGLHDYPFVKPSIDLLELIENSKIPILDIYGSRDFKRVIDQAADRRLAAKKGKNNKYMQVKIEGADHYFTKLEDELIKRIRGWLKTAAPGISIIMNKEDDENE